MRYYLFVDSGMPEAKHVFQPARGQAPKVKKINKFYNRHLQGE